MQTVADSTVAKAEQRGVRAVRMRRVGGQHCCEGGAERREGGENTTAMQTVADCTVAKAVGA